MVVETAIKHLLLARGIRNPTRGIKVDRPKGEGLVLNSEEVKTLLGKARAVGHGFYPHWCLALFTGMRNGELYALRTSDVDLVSGIIHVNKQFTPKDGVHGTKTGLNRTIPIANELRPLLESTLLESLIKKGGYEQCLWKWEHSSIKKERVRFVWKDLLLPRSRQWTKGRQAPCLRQFCRSLGLPEIKFHDLRATFITNMLASRVALNKVMAIVGHRRTETTDRYNRLAEVGITGSTDCLTLCRSDEVQAGQNSAE